MNIAGRMLLIAASASLLLGGIARANDLPLDFPDREILRPLVLPRGMGQLALGFSWLRTYQAFNDEGKLDNIGANFTETSGDFRIQGGVYNGVELQAGIPYISREMDGGEGRMIGFGDLDAALLLEIYRETTGRPTSVILGVRGIFPVGQSQIRSASGPLLHPPSRGTFAVGPMFAVKEAYSKNLAFLYSFEWDFYLKGKQKFDGNKVDSDYGDIFKAGIEPIIQVSDHIAIWLSVVYSKEYRSKLTYDGQTVAEYPAADLLEERPALELQFGHTFDIFIGTACRAWGKNQVGGWPVWAKFELRF